MAANNAIRVSDINFDQIKTNLKAFLSDQNEFLDYDFESSTMSVLLDLLSYNTYYNAFYLNMVGNEMFLDSAQLRNSVVSRAKQLNYIPRSARGATASVNVSVDPDGSPTFFTVAANTKFTTTIDGTSYTFVTSDATSLTPSSNGTFSGSLNLVEGEPLQQRFTVSTTSPVRYILPNDNVDTTSFTVRIQESSSNTSIATYNLNNDISAANSISEIYFIQENEDNKYEVYFGDNVFGKKPKDGNIVIVDYRVVNGSTVNGANNFSGDFTVTTTSAAQGGAFQESIESIKYNAPFKFQAQDRLVTSSDFKNIILAENGDIQAISVWGGEENTPPVYGKVFISVKPTSGPIISATRKSTLQTTLKDRSIVSVETEFVDATYLYINPSITVRYNPRTTSLSASELNTKIQNALISFEANNLGTFGNKFYVSNLTEVIRASDNSFVSADIPFTIEKRFVPTTNAINTYQVQFNNAIHHPHDGHLGAVSSTGFTIGDETVYLEDDGIGNLRTFILVTGNKITRNKNFGTVNYGSGLITIFNTLITGYVGDAISIKMKPQESNIFGIRNEILLVSGASVATVDNDTNNTTSTVGAVATNGTTTTVLTDNAIANYGVSSVASLSTSASTTTVSSGTTTSSSISGSSY
jgi:hypothetical protein